MYKGFDFIYPLAFFLFCCWSQLLFFSMLFNVLFPFSFFSSVVFFALFCCVFVVFFRCLFCHFFFGLFCCRLLLLAPLFFFYISSFLFSLLSDGFCTSFTSSIFQQQGEKPKSKKSFSDETWAGGGGFRIAQVLKRFFCAHRNSSVVSIFFFTLFFASRRFWTPKAKQTTPHQPLSFLLGQKKKANFKSRPVLFLLYTWSMLKKKQDNKKIAANQKNKTAKKKDLRFLAHFFFPPRFFVRRCLLFIYVLLVLWSPSDIWKAYC